MTGRTTPDGVAHDRAGAGAGGGAVAGAARVLGRRVGLRLDPAAQSRLARCVHEAAAARKQDEDQFVASLDSDPAALQELLDRVTVQETSFFRDPGQFEALAAHVLPTLRGPVTAWSAGCANGQEAYSIAMVLAESNVSDWRVVATDISSRALERARHARYSEREVAGVDARRREAHFTREGGSWRVARPLRDRVSVSRLNLAADPLPNERGSCSIVFCRNVLIYFKPPEVVAFLERLAQWMPPDGYLFLGYSESLWQVTDVFKLVRLGGSFAYRPARGATAKPPRQSSVRQGEASAPSTMPPVPVRSRGGSVTPTSANKRAAEQRAVDALPDVPGLLASGEAAAAAGDHEAAVAAFRKAAYLEPDHPIAHLHLGLALEAAGHDNAAVRAYKAGRAAVDRCDTAAVEAALEGYRLDELVALLDAKLGERR